MMYLSSAWLQLNVDVFHTNFTFALMVTEAFSWNIGKAFQALVIRELYFPYMIHLVVCTWQPTAEQQI